MPSIRRTQHPNLYTRKIWHLGERRVEERGVGKTYKYRTYRQHFLYGVGHNIVKAASNGKQGIIELPASVHLMTLFDLL